MEGWVWKTEAERGQEGTESVSEWVPGQWVGVFVCLLFELCHVMWIIGVPAGVVDWKQLVQKAWGTMEFVCDVDNLV